MYGKHITLYERVFNKEKRSLNTICDVSVAAFWSENCGYGIIASHSIEGKEKLS